MRVEGFVEVTVGRVLYRHVGPERFVELTAACSETVRVGVGARMPGHPPDAA